MSTLDSIISQLNDDEHSPLPAGHPIADGKVHRYGKGKKDWYILHKVLRADGAVAYYGSHGVWHGLENNAEKFRWDAAPLSDAERQALEKRERDAAAAEALKRDVAAKNAAKRGEQQWSAASRTGESKYLERKQITPESVRFDKDGTVLMPLIRYDTGAFVGQQKITEDGQKRFNKGMSKTGAACRLGDVGPDDKIGLLVEGYATGRSIRMATDEVCAVFVCLDAGNLLEAATAVRAKYPNLHLVFCADDDWTKQRRMRAALSERYGYDGDMPLDGTSVEWTSVSGVSMVFRARTSQDENGIAYIALEVSAAGTTRTLRFENAGLKYANQAVTQLGNASVCFPVFADRGDRGLTDFNDLHLADGIGAVRHQIEQAMLYALAPPALRERVSLTVIDGGKAAAKPVGKARKKATATAAGAVTDPPEHEAESGAYTWQMDLKRTDKGAIISSLNNVYLILKNDPAWEGVFGYEEFSNRVMKRKAPPYEGASEGGWSDLDDSKAARWIEAKYSVAPRKDFVIDAAHILADQNKYHVVREYLRSLKWDRVPRIADGWLTKYFHIEDNEYSRLVGYKWPISAVARVMNPGCKVDSVLILEGPQGFGKSTAVSVLASAGWFTDAGIEIGNKDTYVTMNGKWIIELGELDAFSKTESSATKRFFSSSVDTYRPPYGRRAIDVPRQAIFVGTVNFDNYLKDSSGNRRYWPIKVLQEIDLKALADIRDQIWAEAYEAYCTWEAANERANGRLARPWDVHKAERNLFKAEQDARQEGDVYEDLFRPHIEAFSQVTQLQLLQDCLKLDISKWTRTEQRRIGDAMKSLGWIRKRRTVGRRDYYYERDERPAPATYGAPTEPGADDAPL